MKQYEAPVLVPLFFSDEDIIRTSGGLPFLPGEEEV